MDYVGQSQAELLTRLDELQRRVAELEAAQRLSAAVEQAAGAVIITDTRGCIQYVNHEFERISGYSQAEVLGQTPRLLQSGEHDAAFYQELWTTISAGKIWHGRLVNKRKDGTRYVADAIITPVRDENGQIANYVSLQRDVTREVQLEEQYRQLQKMEVMGQLTSGIAHDFNNLLTVINGFAELLQVQLSPYESAHELVGKIRDAGRRGVDLVQQLLAFSRKQAIAPRLVDLGQLVTGMHSMLQRVIGEHVELVTHVAPDLWSVKVDPTQMEQVIVNLAVNARDAMPQGGRLTIEVTNVVLDHEYVGGHLQAQPGEHVLLIVSDTGMGMSAEVKAHLFEPFFTTKGQGKGTGLGLAMVYGIVKQNGGNIWVYSEEGLGTTFKIYLPRAEAGAQATTWSEARQHSPNGSETILLVEDDDSVRDLARLVLRRQGYEVLSAADGQEALNIAAAHTQRIHLLLSDLVLPGITAASLSQRLSQLHPGLKTLFMSGYTDDMVARCNGGERSYAFLQKPFSSLELARTVRAVLDER